MRSINYDHLLLLTSFNSSPFHFAIKLNLASHLEDGLGQATDVAGSDTSNGDAAVLSGVDGVLNDISLTSNLLGMWLMYLLGESIHLLGLETGEREHTDLIDQLAVDRKTI